MRLLSLCQVTRGREGAASAGCSSTCTSRVLTLGVGQEAVERRDVAWARGDSDGVVLSEAVSLGNTCTPREMMESGICTSTQHGARERGDGRSREPNREAPRNDGDVSTG